MTTNFRLEHIKFFALVAYIAYLVAILLSATSYNEGFYNHQNFCLAINSLFTDQLNHTFGIKP